MEIENKEDLKIVFINKIGLTHEGNYEYEILYSLTPDLVWAEDFAEQVPSTCSIDDLLPAIDTYHFVRRGICPFSINLARENSCFSMQDCIDGIIALAWIYDEDDNRYYTLPYGASIEESDEFMQMISMEYIKEEVVNTDTGEGEENEDKKVVEKPDIFDQLTNNNEKNESLEYNDEDDDVDLEKLFNGDF